MTTPTLAELADEIERLAKHAAEVCGPAPCVHVPIKLESIPTLLASLRAEGWQPISTADKSSKAILVGRPDTDWGAGEVEPVYWDWASRDWANIYTTEPIGYSPTAWRSLPLPPEN